MVAHPLASVSSKPAINTILLICPPCPFGALPAPASSPIGSTILPGSVAGYGPSPPNILIRHPERPQSGRCVPVPALGFFDPFSPCDEFPSDERPAAGAATVLHASQDGRARPLVWVVFSSRARIADSSPVTSKSSTSPTLNTSCHLACGCGFHAEEACPMMPFEVVAITLGPAQRPRRKVATPCALKGTLAVASDSVPRSRPCFSGQSGRLCPLLVPDPAKWLLTATNREHAVRPLPDSDQLVITQSASRYPAGVTVPDFSRGASHTHVVKVR